MLTLDQLCVMSFCVMTFLIRQKQPLSWIYCIVESWPQGFVREMSCSQVPKIWRQFPRGILVILKSTANFCIFLGQNTWLLIREPSVRTYGPASVWLVFLAWVSKERNNYSLRMMESPSHPPLGKGVGVDLHWGPENPKHSPTHLLLWQSHSAAFLPRYCNLCRPRLPCFKH